MDRMTAASITAVKAGPIAEVPAAALRTAAKFADARIADLSNVAIRPADTEGQVVITAACSTCAVEILAEGICSRQLLVPGYLLRMLTNRHSDAAHVAIVQGEGTFLQVRSYSEGTTVALSGPEGTGSAVQMPALAPGEFEIEPLFFNPNLLMRVLRDLREGTNVSISPFSFGWVIRCTAESWSARCFVAGMKGR
jgi:hypothetical protein